MPDKKQEEATVNNGKKGMVNRIADFDLRRILGYTKTVMVLRIAAAIALFALLIIAIVNAGELSNAVGSSRGAQSFFAEFFKLTIYGVIIYALTELINKPKDTKD